jgi:hypothetical protein
MNDRLFALIQLSSLALLIFVWFLIIRGKLKPAYALIWLGSSLIFFMMALFPKILKFIANAFGVEYTPSILFALGIFFLILLSLVETVVISNLAKNNTELAERLAIMQWRIEQIENNQGSNRINKEEE